MKKKLDQLGQSTIEFILCFIFAVGLIIMVFNSSLNYVSGYVTHYATFMASRVLLTQDSNQAQFGPGSRGPAIEAAKNAFKKYQLHIFGIKSDLEVNDGVSVDSGRYLMIGVYTKYDKKLDIVGKLTGQTRIDLLSESFLGHEPTRGVCAERVCKAITGDGQSCINDARLDITLYDDGC